MTKKNATIWITRDLCGDDTHKIYFWSTKPSWDASGCSYYCDDPKCDHDYHDCESAIVVFDHACDDLSKIFDALGIKSDYTIQKGEMIELQAASSIAKGESMASQAKELAKRMKSKNQKPTQKEIIDFLSLISEDDENDEEEEGD